MKVSTREKLKFQAMELFATQGFSSTTVGAIEKAAGLTARSGGFYRHFPSKMSVLEAIVDEVLAANADNIAQYKAGKDKAFNALVGQVMKASKGKANPAQVNSVLKAKLG